MSRCVHHKQKLRAALRSQTRLKGPEQLAAASEAGMLRCLHVELNHLYHYRRPLVLLGEEHPLAGRHQLTNCTHGRVPVTVCRALGSPVGLRIRDLAAPGMRHCDYLQQKIFRK